MIKVGLERTKCLFIITGISGSGKSTLAKELSLKYGYQVRCLDDYKVDVYTMYEFNNEFERLILRDLAITQFKADLILCLRSGLNAILDYQFTDEWQDWFSSISSQYGYNLLVVNCNTEDFEVIWGRKIARDADVCLRHPCLTTKTCYNHDNVVRASLDEANKDKHYKDYMSGKYTSLKGDFIYDDKQFRELFELNIKM